MAIKTLPKVQSTCPICEEHFQLERLIFDSRIHFFGMKLVDHIAVYQFKHTCVSDAEMFQVIVTKFIPYLDKDIPAKISAGSTDCEGHCMNSDDFSICGQECMYAPFRDLMQKMFLYRKDKETVVE